MAGSATSQRDGHRAPALPRDPGVPRGLARRIAGHVPGRYVSLAYRLREALRPQPFRPDIAAVELHRAERRGRGLLPYPAYLYGMLGAARTAAAVGAPAFTALEFGVAGGNGLRAMELHAATVRERLGVDVHVVGFDSGVGLPALDDPRDCGFALRPGDFRMDEAALRARLSTADLVLGPVEETLPAFFRRATATLPPIGFVSIDLDVYTATLAVLRELAANRERLLPRVTMYFDDLTGYPYSTAVGEWAAIRAFQGDGSLALGQIPNLDRHMGGAARFQAWPRHMFVLHDFDHPDRDRPEQTETVDTRLRL